MLENWKAEATFTKAPLSWTLIPRIWNHPGNITVVWRSIQVGPSVKVTPSGSEDSMKPKKDTTMVAIIAVIKQRTNKVGPTRSSKRPTFFFTKFLLRQLKIQKA
eukprot:Lithocolla_globosa_v1_NODE_798_length_3266_cov_7.270009.p3 type:complete len:104 gc:universal NODE_798_length_3266_cov_7.270009:656-967(+)